MRLPCSFCKGRFCKIYYGKNICPLRELAYNIKRKNIEIKGKDSQDLMGTSPNIFVGHHNWPRVNASFISTPFLDEKAYFYDNPKLWADENWSIDSIINVRTNLFSNFGKINIRTKSNRLVDVIQEIALAKKQADVEFKWEKYVRPKLTLLQGYAILGGKTSVKDAKVVSNPTVERKVEKIVYDTDLKASEAIKILHSKGVDNYQIIKLLSASLLGIKHQRRFVPTRWAITAVDDIISKNLFNEIIRQKSVEKIEIYFSGYLGNYFLIMFIPGPYSYELFEILVPFMPEKARKLQYTHDYELFVLRKNYAEETAGGYYATRMQVLKKLKSKNKKASVLVLRFITKEYYVPLGVFVVREAVGKSLANRIFESSSLKESLEFVKNFAKEKYKIDVREILERSKVLDFLTKQRTLREFFVK